MQDVPVRPDTEYRLSGWIKTDGVPDTGTGAHLQVEGTFNASEWIFTLPDRRTEMMGRSAVLYGSTDWRYVTCIFRTRRDQKKIRVICGLGDYGAQTTGTAYFDGIQLIEVPDSEACGVFGKYTVPKSATP